MDFGIEIRNLLDSFAALFIAIQFLDQSALRVRDIINAPIFGGWKSAAQSASFGAAGKMVDHVTLIHPTTPESISAGMLRQREWMCDWPAPG
jgi:hypothetical protein